ncbi:Hypothetical predicted protein [Octopus vulgaris]|uniref:Uncharacterized protein n=1 Tax=Octopus vulgaris TaxID=6645 RepID=A0AA36BRM7_OCTVU|nr:Hypothetical predicted protein [Octopus vulgaris]
MSLTTASDAINMALEKDKADNVSRLCFPDKERQRQRLREKYFNILIYPLLAGNENLWKMPSSKAVKKSSGTCTVSRTGNCTVSRTGNCTVSSTKTQESTFGNNFREISPLFPTGKTTHTWYSQNFGERFS